MDSELGRGNNQGLAVDGYLQFLVEQVNERGLPLRVTLSVGGAVVSGILIGEQQYFEGLTRALEAVIARSGLRERIERGAANAAQRGPGEGGAPQEARSPEELAIHATQRILERVVGGYQRTEEEARHFVHLRDVRITSPGLQESETGGLWRGRLDQVDGFMLGTPTSRAAGGAAAAGGPPGQ